MAFDEMLGLGDTPREAYRKAAQWLNNAPPDLLRARSKQAELFFRRMGITFAVYGEAESNERLIPFDVVPRIIDAAEWKGLEAGLIQRVSAINAFLKDIYGAQECLKAGILPAELILTNPAYRPEMQDRRPPQDIWVQIAGVDLVRTSENDFHVLEDNVRTPSGVSYMLENREMMMRLFPDLYAEYSVRPVETYTDMLLASLKASAPSSAGNDPTIVVLTPGPFNSAYYEHSFLADKLGVELVEGSDLFVDDDKVFMRTTQGPQQVDVIYRRVDDDFIDPLTFRPDSALGVPGLMAAYHAGNVALTNAVGTGVADDKAVYTYMPEIIRFYTGEEPILKNVPTWRCREPEALREVLSRLDELVVKEVGGSGGYGMLVGPASTKAEIEAFRAKLVSNPDDFIAQPTLALSTAPTLAGDKLVGRHIDLRPFVLSSPQGARVAPGGLTRVALKEGSLVVNSSQGGGTKDTWVLED
ncbi:circularly permuted type 2 ATP-grasp protein [uncultured Brevundimonas sp.]|uniref:circularly permuted type 2 ATP-grasp protein n=1 Tax=uncultured Brevundimonas sp. TaxID=213418 RepID=UPI00262D41C6|nr:circularly permuted type 2 ATP-grasp protein [uncultured Brevundimonas sp.]